MSDVVLSRYPGALAESYDLLADRLSEGFERLILRNFKTIICSKQGRFPEDAIASALYDLQERSLTEKMHTTCTGQEAKFFYYELGKEQMESLEQEKFYRDFMDRFTAFAERIPQYLQNPQSREVIELSKGGDFRKVYGQIDFFDLKSPSIDPTMKNYHNLGANLSDLLNAFGVGSGIEVPFIVPVFNVTWPPPAESVEQAQEEIAALMSYSKKRYYKFDRNLRDYVEVEDGQLTPFEIECSEKHGSIVRLLGSLMMGGGGVLQLVAAPLYCYKALPRNEHGELWANSWFANDVLLEEFNYYRTQII